MEAKISRGHIEKCKKKKKRKKRKRKRKLCLVAEKMRKNRKRNEMKFMYIKFSKLISMLHKT